MSAMQVGRWSGNAGTRRAPASPAVLAVAVTVLCACGGGGGSAAPGTAASTESLVLYTCVSDETIQPVIQAFEESAPGSEVALFRAPTGELNARVAADARSGGLRADVVWACDPLTQHAFAEQGLVGGWTPPEADGLPEQFRTDDSVGAHLLYMVVLHREEAPAPAAWSDLADPDAGTVAVPDPSVAASALGTLGWFAAQPEYGVDFYRSLRDNGAVQVGTPDDVATGVAQGVYDAGVTTANSAYAVQEDGSPVEVVWPEPGAVAVHGPIALATHSAGSRVAKDFISFVVSEEGQGVLAAAGSYPTRPGVPGPTVPADAPVVFPDWAAIARDHDRILADYQRVFGG